MLWRQISTEIAMPKTSARFNPPVAVITASKKGGTGKTMLAATVADLFTLNGYALAVFQADDKMRLATMLGTKVVGLRPDPDLVLTDPALIRRSFTPFYSACAQASANKTSVLLDVGADEVENVANYLNDVEIEDDLATWKLPLIVMVPTLSEANSINSAAVTIDRFRQAVPSAHIVLVENNFGRGPLDSLPASGPARQEFEKHLKPLLAGVTRMSMPGIVTDFWKPYEDRGIRFLKAIAMDKEEGAKRLSMEIGDVKIARRAVTLYFAAMHAELSHIVVLPKGGM